MNRRLVCQTLTFVAIALLSKPVLADGIPEHAMALFERLEGKWQITVTMDGEESVDELVCKLTPNKEGVVWHWEGTDLDSGEVATATGLIGWDGHKGAVVESMISSNGVTFTSIWTGKGDRWTSRDEGTELMDGQYLSAFSKRVFEWESDDKWIIVETDRLLAGNAQPDVNALFTRKN